MRSIGLDVHRDFCEVAIVEDGEVRSLDNQSYDSLPATIRVCERQTTPTQRLRVTLAISADRCPA